jgi:hypothetical protein
VLLLEEVTVDVDGRRVLDRVSLVLPRGTHGVVVVDDGLAGQLLLELVAGSRAPNDGRVRVDGLDPATAPGLEGRIGAATVDESGPLRTLALDRGADVWLLDATTCPSPVLEPWLELLDRPGAPSNPTVLVVVGAVPIPAGDPPRRLLRLRGGRLVEMSCSP